MRYRPSDTDGANESLVFVHQARRPMHLSAVDMSPSSVVDVDSRNIVIGWSPGATRVFGHSAQQALGQQLGDLRPWHDTARMRALRSEMSPGDVWIYHHAINGPDGAQSVAKTWATAVAANRTRPAGFVYCSEVSQSLAGQFSRPSFPLRSAHGQASQLILCDDTLRIQHVGPGRGAVAREDPHLLLGANVMRFVHADDEQPWQEMLGWCLDTPRRTHSAVIRWRGPEGRYRWVEHNMTNFLSDHGIESLAIDCRELGQPLLTALDLA